MLKAYNKAEITFDLIKEIGAAGQNSKTFVSHDHQLDAEIVIKQIKKTSLSSQGNFFDESKALYASAHPNVVQIHYACEDSDNIFLAMPHYQRGPLSNLINGQHMTVREIVSTGCQVLSGLHNVHSKGLIHFDIKPGNVLLSDRGEAVISDFGLAKQMTYGFAHQDRIYGRMTPPEGIRNDKFNITFDVYQFGITLYRMCNGDEVFYRQYKKYGAPACFDRSSFLFDLRNGRFPDRTLFPPHVPDRLRKAVRRCLETEPSKRFQSAIDVANALAPIDGNFLDWRLAETSDMRTWTKSANGSSYTLQVTSAGHSECYKKRDSGNPRRIRAACQASFSDGDIKKFLGSH